MEEQVGPGGGLCCCCPRLLSQSISEKIGGRGGGLERRLSEPGECGAV